MKLSSRDQVTVMSPTTGAKLLEIPFKKIRRMGNMEIYSTAMIWFETCDLRHKPEQFHFCIVPSGIQTTHLILRELKTATECATGVLLITEESNGLELSFISRQHYGCPEYPLSTRNNVLQSGLRFFSHISLTVVVDDRRSSEPVHHEQIATLEDFATKNRRQTTAALQPHAPKWMHSNGMRLDKYRSNSSCSSSHCSGSGSGELSDPGVMNDVFEGSASSMPYPIGYNSGSDSTLGKSSDPGPMTSRRPPLVPPRSQISLATGIGAGHY